MADSAKLVLIIFDKFSPVSLSNRIISVVLIVEIVNIWSFVQGIHMGLIY